MDEMNQQEALNDRQWSQLWERYLEEAIQFDPLTIHEINCIVPIPDRAGVLIFTDTEIHFSNVNAVKTLHRFSSAHSFSDYEVLSICLKKLGHFGKYKMPWACPFFALFPLEGKDQTIWLNPIKLSNVFKVEARYFAELTNGLRIVLPLHRRRFIKRAEIACLVLATIRRGVFHYAIKGEVPLDFLYFPDTPFARLLRNRPCLKMFQTPIGQINRLYQQTYSLYHCEPLMDDPEDSDHIDWL